MMKQIGSTWRWWLKSLAYLIAATLFCTALLNVVLAQAASGGGDPPAWVSPNAMTVRRISPVGSAQHQPVFLNNLDCNLVTYRLTASGTMQSGCFTETAFGLLDSDSEMAIFNGADEGLPLLPSSAHQVLAPWPGALDLVALDNASTGGSYISLYKNPLAHLEDQRNLLLQLTAKQLTAPPELTLKDPSGQRLVINPQTLAFSDGGSWLVAETLNGSFVRINLASLDVTAFAPAFGSQGSPGFLASQVAISHDGRYVAINNQAADSFKVYDLTTCSGLAVNLHPLSCKSYDYRAFVKSQVSGFQAIQHVRYINDGLLGFEVTTNNSGTAGIYELAPVDGIVSLTDYLGLGDSYTSGEGAFNYLADTDSDNNMCHLSARSYPLLLTHDLFSAQGGHSVACSGATISDVGSTSDSYRGQVRGVASFQQLQHSQLALLASIMANFAPGYLAQQRFVGLYQPGVTTVSVGGDDIGFGDIVEQCAELHVSLHLSDGTCFNTYEDRLELTKLIDRTVPRWAGLYKQLVREAPGTRLYAIGYPQVVADNGKCAINVHLNKSELEFAQELIDYLNNGIKLASEKAGVTYVDISQALNGHRLCEAASYNVAINGLTAGKDIGVLGVKLFGKESYHPNALGQALIEQAILQRTHNLTNPIAATGGTNGNQKLLNAPKTGRVVANRIPVTNLTPRVAKRGRSTAVKASGASNGLKAHTAYNVRLDGSTGAALGSTTSNESGDIETSATISGETTSGPHTIDVTGVNQAGEPIDIIQPIYVLNSDTDSDGDGIADPVDSCPLALNSGQDSDQDGIDDVCDPVIGLPLASGPSGSSSGTTGTTSPPQTPTKDAGQTVPAEVSGEPLDTPSPTVVTNFAFDTFDGGQPTADSHSLAHVLGTATINPTNTPLKAFKPSLKAHKANVGTFHVPYPALRVINWLLWLILLIIAWLLLLLIYTLLNHKINTKTGRFQLQ